MNMAVSLQEDWRASNLVERINTFTRENDGMTPDYRIEGNGTDKKIVFELGVEKSTVLASQAEDFFRAASGKSSDGQDVGHSIEQRYLNAIISNFRMKN